MPRLPRSGYYAIGAVLRSLMDARGGLTVSRLSAMTGIRINTVLNYAEGRQQYHPDHLYTIAHALGVSIWDLDPPALRARSRRGHGR